MTDAIRLELFLMLSVGAVIAVVITLFILKRMGKINPAVGQAQDEALAAQLRQDHPAFANLTKEEQLARARQVRTHPAIWAFAVAVLGGFLWTALSVPAVLDWINQGARAAGLVGIAVLAVVLGGIALIKRVMIARMLAMLG